MRRAHLLKVLVQTVWVEIDGDGLAEERVGEVVAVSAAEWPGFYERWKDDFAALQAAVEAKSFEGDSSSLHEPESL